MLIYDHNKEFIGIDEESLKLLGYKRFEDLIHEHKDIAELFVKKPGYIHNFTNFPWIDFVLHAESDDAKVIIAGKEKAFSATIEVLTLHLNKSPDQDAFLIKLNNVQNYQLDASERPEPTLTPAPVSPEKKELDTPPAAAPVVPEPVLTPEPVIEAEPAAVIEPAIEEQQEQAPLTFDEDIFLQDEVDTPPVSTPAEEEELDIFFHEEEEEVQEEQRVETALELPTEEESVFDRIQEDDKSAPMLGAYLSEEDREYLADLEFDDDYLYDPQIAADELGLPVDLIEEFIGDFIKQAHEFKEQLFTATANEDLDNIKGLSHKLKGVAANLRIEDSFEVLRNVNETSDMKECEANLKKFYITIAKLEGKDVEVVKRELDEPVKEELYDLTPKLEPAQEEEILPPLNLPEVEEKIIQPLDLPELDEKETFTAPIQLDTLSQETEPAAAAVDDSSDLYDFGLVTENSNEPLIVLDDEEEILSDIQDFEPESPADIENTPLLTYDVNTAAAEIGLSADLVSALIDDYIVEANDMKNRLNEVIASSDVIRWKGYAIQLKGVSDNLRILEISDALQKLITSTEDTQAKAAMQEFYGFINQL
ncbi:MAG: hypothetical protein ABFR02_04805 [Campylobacterota bacterium]